MKLFRTILLSILTCFTIYTILLDNTVQGVNLDDTLYANNPLSKAKYTVLIIRTLSEDANALKKLTNFWCGGGAGCYDHGWVLLQILYKMGDNKFSETANLLNKTDKSTLLSLLMAGAEYGMPRNHYYVENHYPITVQVLLSRQKPQ